MGRDTMAADSVDRSCGTGDTPESGLHLVVFYLVVSSTKS